MEIPKPRPTEDGSYRTIGYDVSPFAIWAFIIGIIGCMVILKHEGIL